MLIVSNWKAYVTDIAKAKKLISIGRRASNKKLLLVVAPSAPYLGMFASGKAPKSGALSFGAQDISISTGGASTGEVTASVLTGLGITHVIVGHSERRAMGETDAQILLKTQHALAHGLVPILCIGERRRDPEAKYLQFLRMQLAAVLGPLSPKERQRVIIAYEPVWAIGKSAAESILPQDLHEMVLYIRKALSEYVPNSGKKTIILYGGSVEPTNIRELAAGSQVNGFLIGHASADAASYTALIKALA